MDPSGKGHEKQTPGVIRGATYVKPVIVVVQQCWKDTWEFRRCLNGYDKKKSLQGKAEKGIGNPIDPG